MIRGAPMGLAAQARQLREANARPRTPLQALHALGLEVVDVLVMKIEVRETLEARTADLIASFGGGR